LPKRSIAILGATSHIAKGLIYRFLQSEDFHLHLYSRSVDTLKAFLSSIGQQAGKDCTAHNSYKDFEKHHYDVILNLTGPGTNRKIQGDYTLYFSITEQFDNLVLDYLKDRHPDTLYISFSSGAVYGKGFSEPVDEWSVNQLQVNHMAREDYYGIVRINAEAKHRANVSFRIADLRIFSYFSRYIDLTDGYFITDVLTSILQDKVLITGHTNIIRDYLHPDDLFTMILLCINASRMNQAFDVSSSQPAAKQEILDYFSAAYGLKYEYRDSPGNTSATGAKSNYYSMCNQASQIGYKPRFSSMDTIIHESKYILSQQPIEKRRGN